MLGLLREGSLTDLFWSMVVTGSFGMAIWVVAISCASNFVKEIIYR
jgi:hypothetical protein